MEIIPSKFRKAWSNHEVSILVLASLVLQMFLIFFSLFRQRRANYMLSLLLWSSYLGADYVATLALGNLLNQQNQALEEQTTGDLTAFWAPFLLLHLGGPDTITSYSLEDNQLWKRHLLGLLLHVSIAIFIFLESLPSPHLWQTAIVVFAAGILKYGERTWSLRSASVDRLREFMPSEPIQFVLEYHMLIRQERIQEFRMRMQEYRMHRNLGLESEIRLENEPLRLPPMGETTGIEEEEIVFWAHRFFQTFKLFTVNLVFTFQDPMDSLNFFLRHGSKHAFYVIETELSLFHDMLHTKAVHVHNGMGRTMRFLSITMAVLALVLFYRANKEDFRPGEIRITYNLLIAALAIEVIAIVLLVFSDWTIVALQQNDRLSHPLIVQINEIVRGRKLARLIVKIRRLALGEIAMRKWSNSMMQYNLIRVCLRDYKWKRLERFVQFLGMKHGFYIWLKNKWDGCFHANQTVSDDLKDLIFNELWKKLAWPSESTHNRCCRGECVLQDNGYGDLDWSVKKEFDESILLWHIATHLCYIEDQTQGAAATVGQEENKNIPTIWKRISQAMRMIPSGFPKSKKMIRDGLSYAIGRLRKIWSAAEPDKDLGKNQPSAAPPPRDHPEISRYLSEYMMFLLMFKPSMLPAGIGKVRFQDTCAETMKFFNCKDTDISEAVATNAEAKDLKLAEQKGASANSIGWKDTFHAIGCKLMEIGKRKEKKKEKEKAACDVLLRVETSTDPIDVKGGRSTSVLFDACKLVKQMKESFKERPEKKWEVISAVWVEMLCFAASKCGADAHARQLSQGGELLTHVWLLMVHFGIGEQYRIGGPGGEKLTVRG